MKPLLFFCVVVGLLLAQSSLADSPARPVPFVTASRSGLCFFKMVPAKRTRQENGRVTTREAFGIAYSIEEDGSFRELWKTSGWYSFGVFLSDDGQYLVRMGPWSVGHKPEKADLAVAFYKNGKLLKEYSTADLVEDRSKVIASVSHYFWLAGACCSDDEKSDPENILMLDYRGIFHLKTIDGIKYEFDVKSGKILSKKKS